MLSIPEIRVPRDDWKRLTQYAFSSKCDLYPAAPFLRAELQRAVIDDDALPAAAIVRLNDWVTYRLDRRAPETRKLVHPDDVDTSAPHLSLLSSLGTALIGVRVEEPMPFLCTEGKLHMVTPLNTHPTLARNSLRRGFVMPGPGTCCPPMPAAESAFSRFFRWVEEQL